MGSVLHSAAHTAVAPWEHGKKKDKQAQAEGGSSKGGQQAQAARKVLARWVCIYVCLFVCLYE